MTAVLSKEQDLVVEHICVLLDAWHDVLAGGGPLLGQEIAELSSRGDNLASEARVVDLGGLSHHLESLAKALTAPSPDRAEVTSRLKTIGDICWQVSQDPANGPASNRGLAPPKILSIIGDAASFVAAEGALGAQSLLDMPPVIRHSEVKKNTAIPPPKPSTEAPFPPVEDLSTASAARTPQPSSLAPPPAALPAEKPIPAAPKLEMGTMFGLRAFGRVRPRTPVPESSSSPNGLLGLGGKRSGPRESLQDDLSRRLTSLRTPNPRQAVTRPPLARSPSAPAKTAQPTARRELQQRPPRAVPDLQWRLPWRWALALLTLLVVGVTALLLTGRSSRAPHPATASGSISPAQQTGLPRSKLLSRRERLRLLIAQVHATGGAESPELADLIDEESALVREAMATLCASDEQQCNLPVPQVAGTLGKAAGDHLIRDLFDPREVSLPDSPGNSGRTPRWLAGLTVPAIGAETHPKVKRWLKYFTENGVGRERFQTILFRCGEFQDLIEQTLAHYSLPISLLALVITESGCIADIKSPAGAKGLWQFMPATARAYHLRVKDGVVDERVSPAKATEAAVHFLSDLKKKMGSWEFALASYNMGPFGLAARVRKAGGNVNFWQLADAQLLPEETANYVPRIQAYALILANLERFNFSASQRRTPVAVSDFEAPAGTRLGQVARATGASVTQLKRLNPDIVGQVVPTLPGSPFLLQLPKRSVFRARSALEKLLESGDEADRCVPSDFDWGTQRFTARMASECRGD